MRGAGREGRRGAGVPGWAAVANDEAGARAAFLYDARFRVGGVGDGLFVFVVIDDAVDTGGVDGAEGAVDVVVVDENPAGVFRFEGLTELGKGREVGQGDEVGRGDVGVVAERSVFRAETKVGGGDVEDGDV